MEQKQNKEWYPGMDMGFEVGQTVYFHGNEYVVTMADPTYNKCEAKSKEIESFIRFKKDGTYYDSDKQPSVFHKPQTYDISRPEWQPKPGEWCWFWNHPSSVQLEKFVIKKNGTYYSEYAHPYQYCAPFKGELPEHFKA